MSDWSSFCLFSLRGDMFFGKSIQGQCGLLRTRNQFATFDTTLFPSPVINIVECQSALYAFYDHFISRSTDYGDSWQRWDRGAYDSTEFKLLVENPRGTLIACLSTNQMVVAYDH